MFEVLSVSVVALSATLVFCFDTSIPYLLITKNSKFLFDWRVSFVVGSLTFHAFLFMGSIVFPLCTYVACKKIHEEAVYIFFAFNAVVFCLFIVITFPVGQIQSGKLKTISEQEKSAIEKSFLNIEGNFTQRISVVLTAQIVNAFNTKGGPYHTAQTPEEVKCVLILLSIVLIAQMGAIRYT
ncbi:hypothetical protein EIN_182680 [Entamoeba invadens IP1]|uniref:hypothetical protein n=1 Tax=Entamoeba invadens IP1 TaxID=370355 RepID=UPI0002C3DD47|nr:hypothetical protein EIN_182680 [Entamoeba invadens IP1]ELP94031.1 hypothetical protein EIN_182680 [Entamoeba invadens IP1]|eukprot:XP_004260802.1 hypothetical protein EIN_182680 [Entamoeba invadens IP1]